MHLSIAALTLPIVPGSPQVIIPAGTFDAPNGSLKGQGPWTLNDQDGIALTTKANSGTDIVVDYEHQTILSAQNGQPAPAAGWLIAGGFEWQPDIGMVATKIRWTTEAADMIQEGEYRFLSPVFSYTPEGVPSALLSVALTNTPALSYPQEVAIAATNRGLLMSETTPTPSVVVTTPVPPVPPPPVAALAQPIATPPVDSMSPMIAMLTAQLVSAREEAALAKAKLSDFERQVIDGTRQALITAALSSGKLLPPMEAWARNLPLGDLQEFINKSTPLAALTSTQTKGQPPQTSTSPAGDLNEDEIAICKQLHISHEKYLEQRGSLKERN